jgi:fibronectin type 3 domain-containing protein
MSIIVSQPEFFRKNEDNIIVLNRNVVKAIPRVVADSHFSNDSRWMHVTLNYRSVYGNQIEVVLVDATKSQFEGILNVSPRARNEFFIDCVVIHDFDNGWISIPREDLDAGQFDFIFDSRFNQPSLTVTLQNKKDAVLTWTQADETDSSTQYAIYRRINNGSFNLLTTVTGVLTYSDLNLPNPDTTYSYKVEIQDFDKYLPATQVRSVTTTRPAAPQNLVATTTPGQVTLNWSPVSGSTYSLYRSIGTGLYSLVISGLSNTSYIDNSISNGTTYNYRVRAFDAYESLDSNTATIIPMGPITLNSLQNLSQTSMRVNYTTAAGSTSTNLFYKRVSDSTYTQVNNISNPYTISGLSSATEYTVYLVAVNIYTTQTSNSLNKTTPIMPDVPTNVQATLSGVKQITVTWDAALNAQSYRVYRSVNGGTYSVHVTQISGTTFVDNSVSYNSSYTYRISSLRTDDIQLESNLSLPSNTVAIPEPEAYIDIEQFNMSNQLIIKTKRDSYYSSYDLYHSAGKVSFGFASSLFASSVSNGITNSFYEVSPSLSVLRYYRVHYNKTAGGTNISNIMGVLHFAQSSKSQASTVSSTSTTVTVNWSILGTPGHTHASCAIFQGLTKVQETGLYPISTESHTFVALTPQTGYSVRVTFWNQVDGVEYEGDGTPRILIRKPLFNLDALGDPDSFWISTTA